MGFYLDFCNNSMKHKYLASLSEDEKVKCIHIEKKTEIRITLQIRHLMIILLIKTKNLIYILLSVNLR